MFLPVIISGIIGYLVAGWSGLILSVVFLFLGAFKATWDLTPGPRKRKI